MERPKPNRERRSAEAGARTAHVDRRRWSVSVPRVFLEYQYCIKGSRGVAWVTASRASVVTMLQNITRARSEHPRSCTDTQIHPSSATGRVISFELNTHTAHRTHREPSLLTAVSNHQTSAERHAHAEAEMSLAAGIVARASGQSDHGPAHVQAAYAEHAQTGTNARAPSGAPVKKETMHHRRRASL